MATIRPAREEDVDFAHTLFFQNEIGERYEAMVGEHREVPPPTGISADFWHKFRTGSMWIAERNDKVVGFAATIRRGRTSYLSDLFVARREQSSKAGSQLLAHAFAADGTARFTTSTSDSRALALYVRAGLQPEWPNFCLRAIHPVAPGAPGITVHETAVDDVEIVRWDGVISGRGRPEDHPHWVNDQAGVPLWFRRGRQTIGYGFVRFGAGSLWFPHACTLGPIGVLQASDSADVVAAAVAWARQRAEVLYVDVPGPNPALRYLLEAGFRIFYIESFMADSQAMFDPRRYIGSGDHLF